MLWPLGHSKGEGMSRLGLLHTLNPLLQSLFLIGGSSRGILFLKPKLHHAGGLGLKMSGFGDGQSLSPKAKTPTLKTN